MPVTTSAMTALSGSTWKETLTRNEPDSIQV
jgi:hypothetical protein